ncbi:MAG: hypothetical protein VB124_03975 [Burkholderia sp.]
MKKSDLLRSSRHDGSGFVDRYLPADAEVELARLVSDQCREIDVTTFLTFASIREKLSQGRAGDHQTDREASQIMTQPVCRGPHD